MAEVEMITITSKEFDPGWVTVGQTSIGELKVRKWIPYAEKERLGLAMAMICANEDTDNEMILLSHKMVLLREFLFLANYTNVEIDIPSEGEEETQMNSEELMETVVDWFASTGLQEEAKRVAEKDWDIVEEIMWMMIDAYTDAYENSHSLASRVKKSLGDILSGESIGETIGSSEEVVQKMTEFMKSYLASDGKKESGKIPMMGGLIDLNGVQVDVRKKADD